MIKKISHSILLGLVSMYSMHAAAMMQMKEGENTKLLASQIDCMKAANNCMLQVIPSEPEQSVRSYQISQICNGFAEYNYNLTLKDQLTQRKFLGRSFCKGVVSVSNMDLPFASPAGIQNENAGRLLMKTTENSIASIMDDLNKLKALATDAQNCKTDSECNSLETMFQSVVREVDRMVITTQFAGISTLAGGHLLVPVDHHQHSVFIQLPKLLTNEEGLNISNLSVATNAQASLAAKRLTAAMDYANAELANFQKAKPELEMAAKRNEVVTSIDLNSNEFVVTHTHS